MDEQRSYGDAVGASAPIGPGNPERRLRRLHPYGGFFISWVAPLAVWAGGFGPPVAVSPVSSLSSPLFSGKKSGDYFDKETSMNTHAVVQRGSNPIFSGQTMSSLEISSLTQKKHKNVIRDIGKLIDEGAFSGLKFEPASYKDRQGKDRPMYRLDFEASLLVVTGYDAARRAAVIKRWSALERGEVRPAMDSLAPITETLTTLTTALAEIAGRLSAIEQGSDRPTTPAPRLADNQPEPSQTVREFVRERCQVAGDRTILKSFLYQRYREFCRERGALVDEYNTFLKMIYRTGAPVKSARIKRQGRLHYVVRGLGAVEGRP
jgi:Rha family phage regulatory protein